MADTFGALVEYGKGYPASAVLFGVTLLIGAVHESRIVVVVLTSLVRLLEREVTDHEKALFSLRKAVARLRAALCRFILEIARFFRDPDSVDSAEAQKNTPEPTPRDLDISSIDPPGRVCSREEPSGIPPPAPQQRVLHLPSSGMSSGRKRGVQRSQSRVIERTETATSASQKTEPRATHEAE